MVLEFRVMVNHNLDQDVAALPFRPQVSALIGRRASAGRDSLVAVAPGHHPPELVPAELARTDDLLLGGRVEIGIGTAQRTFQLST